MNNNKPKSQQDIPKIIIKTAKFMEAISSKLAVSFAYKLFITPINHKIPKREKHIEENSEQRFVDIPTIQKKIRVLEYGKSVKKVLLVHGWSGRGTQLVSIADAFIKKGYQIISFDAPAHGKSEGKTSHMILFIECILELERIYGKFEIAVGHSLGGMSIINAIKRNFKPEKVITIGSADVVFDIFEGFIENLQLKKHILFKLKKKFEKKFNSKLSDFDVFRNAKDVYIPVFVIHDRQDTNVPYSCAEHIFENLPNGKLLITEGLGHRKILGDTDVICQILEFSEV